MTWTEERRAAQAARIRKTKPWLKATGPRTAEGKKKSSMNALKHGNRSQHTEQLRKALRHQREFMRLALAFLAADRLMPPQTNYKSCPDKSKR